MAEGSERRRAATSLPVASMEKGRRRRSTHERFWVLRNEESVLKRCYIDPLNGYKFYSKPEVLRYLETTKNNSCTPKQEKKCTTMHSPSKEDKCTLKEKKCNNMHSPSKEDNCTPKKEKKCTKMHSPSKKKDNCTSKKEKKRNNMHSPSTEDYCTPKKEEEEDKCTNVHSPSKESKIKAVACILQARRINAPTCILQAMS